MIKKDLKRLIKEERMNNNQDYLQKYLEELAEKFPTKESAVTEIINLSSILALPRSVEHFMSDLHGQADAFEHILNNASGGIRFRISQIFANTLPKETQDELATIIYYPEEKMNEILKNEKDPDNWYRLTLLRIIEVTKKFSSRYTRSKVRKQYDENLSYILDELLNNKIDEENKDKYYQTIISTIIELGYAKNLIIALSSLIKRLAVDELHIIGDIYDRGPEPHKIMDLLEKYHSVDIEWGNHDILWLGASLGSNICVSGVITNSVRHNNLDILEDVYGINLRPLANFAESTYNSALIWRPRKTTEEDYYHNQSVLQTAKIHKAISIIMYKLEGTFANNHKYYQMTHRCLLDKINYENKTINIEGTIYSLEDTDFPTIDKQNPYKLTAEEEKIITELTKSFQNSELLQRHMKVFIEKGSMYKIENNNLMYHALVPLNKDGSLKEVTFENNKYKGKELFDYLDKKVRELYYRKGTTSQYELDLMWYLWSGPDSPFFGKDKMTTLERVLIKDKSSHKEKRNAYYQYQENQEVMEQIMHNFGLIDTTNAHIINGHIPVEKINGETPLKANNKVIVIDGGFSKAYQKTTGIAGYTLVSGSTGMRIIAHEPFTSTKDAIINNEDINYSIDLENNTTKRLTIADVDSGKILQNQIADLKLLIKYYELGLIKENNTYRYIKVLSKKY